MKIAFLLLLLANLTVWLYERYHPSPFPSHNALQDDMSAYREPIVLSREWPSDKQPLHPDKDTQQAASPTVPFFCYEAGPFDRYSQVIEWNRALDGVAFSLQSTQREGSVIFGYLVVYMTDGSASAIQSALSYLQSLGITDAYPLSNKEYQGAISIAAFGNEILAHRMQQDLATKGIKAVIKPRTRNKKQHYVLFTLPDRSDEHWNAARQRFQKIPIIPLPDDDAFCSESRARFQISETPNINATEPTPLDKTQVFN